ncbi:MAG TPA: hypothetical protein VFT57_01390, partial [Gemmatimonadaceae bacterium]|nr:hypothetical protein [Gemmatimonadaceae bacterium]
ADDLSLYIDVIRKGDAKQDITAEGQYRYEQKPYGDRTDAAHGLPPHNRGSEARLIGDTIQGDIWRRQTG